MSAILSACGSYRFRLERSVQPFGKVAAGFMVNPSRADAKTDDHTIRKWFGFSRVLHFRRFIIGNKFAFRATDVNALKTAADPIGPGNDQHIEQIMRDADVHIVAWGPLAKLPKHLRKRWLDIVLTAELIGCPLYCFGTAQDGQPLHPLTLGYDSPLQLWTPP